jgi:hypothetical protein
MKRVIAYVMIFGCLLLFYGCPWDPHKCDYEYPINIKGLRDTVKITDTLWVENDFDPRFCLEQGTADNGSLTELLNICKLINDSLIFCEDVIVINNVRIASSGYYYHIEVRKQNGRYQSKYAIVFPDIGTYSLRTSLSGLGGKGTHIYFYPYFYTPDNNFYLLPEKSQEIYRYYSSEIPYHYRKYFVAVVP